MPNPTLASVSRNGEYALFGSAGGQVAIKADGRVYQPTQAIHDEFVGPKNLSPNRLAGVQLNDVIFWTNGPRSILDATPDGRYLLLSVRGPFRSASPECSSQDYVNYVVRYDTVTAKAVILNLVPNDAYLVSAGPMNSRLEAKISHDGLTVVTNSAGNDQSGFAHNPLVYRWLTLDPNLANATASVTRHLNYATSQLTTLCPTGTIIRP